MISSGTMSAMVSFPSERTIWMSSKNWRKRTRKYWVQWAILTTSRSAEETSRSFFDSHACASLSQGSFAVGIDGGRAWENRWVRERVFFREKLLGKFNGSGQC